MTHSELGKWRKVAPVVIFGVCILPWFIVRAGGLAAAEPAKEVIVPVLALVAASLYIGLDLHRPFWEKEIDTYVGKQIRENVLEMLPKDLGVTESEKQELLQKEIFKSLTGVFWEAIDNNDVLRSQKEHFYSNGFVYTTSIDVFLICGVAGFAYTVASIMLWKATLAYTGVIFIAIALVSRGVVTPRRRKIHLSLSAEQLDQLRRRHSDFVADHFRQIVIGWRRDRLLRQ